MTAQMRIDQAGLPAGTPGFARTDGLDTGALVTLTSLGSGSTHKFQLLWVPPGDSTAVASLAQTGPTTWTFSPDVAPDCFGSYRIELIVDEGLPTEARQIRIFGIRTAAGLLVPAANEIADPNATLLNNGAQQIAASENNEPFAPFSGGSAWGWWKSLSEWILSGGGGGVTDLQGAYDGGNTIDTAGGGPVDITTPDDDSGALAVRGAAGALRVFIGGTATPSIGGPQTWYPEIAGTDPNQFACLGQIFGATTGEGQRVATFWWGQGNPEGVVPAMPGSWCAVTPSNAGVGGLWFKRTGDSDTGWVQATPAQPTIDNGGAVDVTLANGVYTPDTSGGDAVLDVDDFDMPGTFLVIKDGADANKITLNPTGDLDINGGGAGVDFDLQGSTNPGPGLAWLCVADGAGTLRVVH